jgi:hypothetical protein
MARFPGFIGGSNTSQSLIADAERTVNLYVQSAQSQAAKSPSGLFPTPGFTRWANVADVGGRALVNANQRLFGIQGNGFYEFSSTGVPTKIGTVLQDSNPAQFAFNGVVGGQLGICSGGGLYSFDLTTNAFGGPYAPRATMIAYAKGYGLAFDALSGKVYLSGLNNLTSWSLGTFFQRSEFPDPWQAMWVDANNLIWLPGTETFEVWYFANAAATQPWAPLSGLCGLQGIAAPFAFGVSNAGMYWLGRSAQGGATMVATRGSAPQSVSTYAVDTAIASYVRSTRISDAEILMYHDQGHTFANVAFPSAGATWSLDAEAHGWAERGQWNSAAGTYGLWAPRCHADCFGKHLVSDRATGTIWEMSTDIATDVDGLGIRRLRRTPGLTDEHRRIAIDQFEILADVGIAGQGLTPEVMLRVSRDGGRTFGNERRCGSGRVGEYLRRIFWNKLGSLTDAVLEVTWSDAVPVRVVDAFVNNAEKAA